MANNCELAYDIYACNIKLKVTTYLCGNRMLMGYGPRYNKKDNITLGLNNKYFNRSKAKCQERLASVKKNEY